MQKFLKDIKDEEIESKKCFLGYYGKLKPIIAVNRRDWLIRCGSKNHYQTFAGTPFTIVEVKE